MASGARGSTRRPRSLLPSSGGVGLLTEGSLNLDWLSPTLAVGGSFAGGQVERLARDHDIRAVVDMRAEACDDVDELERQGIRHLHLPTEDHCAVSQSMLSQGVAFACAHLDRGERVLIHCEHGIGRAPSLALCVLVAQGQGPLEALALAKDKRPLVSPSPAQYEAWAAWLAAWKSDRSLAWDVPDFDAFARIAYRHLAVA